MQDLTPIFPFFGWTSAQAGAMVVARGASETTGMLVGNLGTFSDSGQANIWANAGGTINGQSAPCGCN